MTHDPHSRPSHTAARIALAAATTAAAGLLLFPWPRWAVALRLTPRCCISAAPF
ncbi:hypothetical protein ACFSC4_01060 [Deinococcus malanensis]|uniref:hypothetical protein n=1 Tax=Deinococcus malanensis TaxID=1706855 RepID=UPI00362B043D